MEEGFFPKTLSHYRIVSKLGAGGMGEVYLARDTKLDRKVALKVLPADIASHRDRMERFVREAKSAAALNHPNIAHVYDIGECGGIHYIAMEFIDGETLREKIHRDRTPLPKLLKYLNQVAEGLSKAHAAGIVHRDLKPDNIMITRDDYAKVLDFGLAKLVEPQRSFGSGDSGPSEIATAVMQQHSMPGTVMGTIGYMSPEQASGRIEEIDHRSDIFSFGCILFEAATGKRAFEGKDALDSLHKIVHAPTPQLREVNPLAPDDLQRVVRRCLAKEPEKRYQSIKELAIELDDLQQELKSHTGFEYSSRSASPPVVTSSEPTQVDEGFWVAVLPFKYRGSNVELEALAEGLSEEIVTGLSRFSYLRVIAQSTTSPFTGESADVRTVGKELGARYVMEGSLRQAGSVLRISVQLVDTNTGAHLWAENYNRTFRPDSVFELQDDLVPRIVSTVADMHGVLPRSMSEAVRLKPADQITPYEALLYSFGYNERFTLDALAEARICLERAVQQEPGNADCWAMLSLMYSNEYGHWDIQIPESPEKALRAARTAVQLAPLHALPYYALAQALFFRKEIPAFRVAAERAVSLSPMDGATAAFMGLLIAYSGDWERGCALAERGLQLNPNHPGWYVYTAWHDAYRKKDYRAALDLALKLNAPDNFYTHAVLAMCYAQLGQMEAARKAVRDLLALKPDYPKIGRQLHAKWIQPELVEELMDGLRKAGLEVAGVEQSKETETSRYGDFESEPLRSTSLGSASSETRAQAGFWVAVLPFKAIGMSSEITALADGLSEEIVTGLSRFSYLRVIARSSTLQYAGEAADIRSVGKKLGARYLMEGSLRQAGSTLRLSVQLLDTSTGAHLWAETYDRPFHSEDIFALQDELVPRIVSTVADWYGVLPHSMSEAVRLKPPDQLSPYEAVLRSFGYYERVTAEEHASARAALERAVQQSPGNADGWAMLSMMYGEEHRFGYNPQPDPLGRSLQAARRAVEAAPSNHYAYLALAQALFFRKEFDAFRSAAERAIALNPMDGSTIEYMGHLIAFSGDWGHGCKLAEHARQLNPHHPGWYWAVPFYNAYRNGDYTSARPFALKLDMPTMSFWHVMLGAVYGQLGEREAAGKAVRDLLVLKPDFATTGRAELEKWYQPELVEHLMDGLRKAGLETGSPLVHAGSGLVSSEFRVEEGFWVAVLPFKSSGTNPEVNALAEGLSEEIVTGLSRFSYLRVIAHSSTSRTETDTSDLRIVGKELGARYVLEGSLRQAGATLRLAVKLVDTSTGEHLWAETYDRTFKPESVFELQDELVPRIVSTIADMNGVLPRSMSEVVRNRTPEELTPYEALLRSFGYFERVTPEYLADALACLELAVRKAPAYADAWAMLALLCVQDYAQGFDLQADALAKGASAAKRAVETAPSNHLAHFSLAQALFFQKEFQSLRNAVDRTLALNPMDGNSIALLGEMVAYAGDWERGLALAKRARQLNPHHPGWYWHADFHHAYRQRDYQLALDVAHKMNAISNWGCHTMMAAAYAQLDQYEAAAKALRELIRLKPDAAATVPKIAEKWFDREHSEHLLEGLRKAGLLGTSSS